VLFGKIFWFSSRSLPRASNVLIKLRRRTRDLAIFGSSFQLGTSGGVCIEKVFIAQREMLASSRGKNFLLCSDRHHRLSLKRLCDEWRRPARSGSFSHEKRQNGRLSVRLITASSMSFQFSLAPINRTSGGWDRKSLEKRHKSERREPI
jgi:hypothetical protein